MGHEYCKALRYPRRHSVAVSTVMVSPVQGRGNGAVKGKLPPGPASGNIELPAGGTNFRSHVCATT